MPQFKSRYFLTVIVPAYNLEKYFEECMESLEQQTFPKKCFEVIVVDDCSTDGTYEKALNYETELNLRVDSLNTNSGPGIARNKGLELSQGKYVCFLDGDDLLVPEALSTVSDLISRFNPDLLTFNWTYLSDVEGNGGYVPRRRDLEEIPVDRESFIPHYLGMNMDGSVIYSIAKRHLFEDYEIIFPSGYHEDIPVLFQMYYAAKTIHKSAEVLYVKRNVRGSVVNTLTRKHVQGYLQAWPQILHFLQRQNLEVMSYMRHYYRGVSGHVCTLINKCFVVNAGSFHERQRIYGYIMEALEQDNNLRKPYTSVLPNSTEKDKVTQLFLTHMENSTGSLSRRARQFEKEYYIESNRGEFSGQR